MNFVRLSLLSGGQMSDDRRSMTFRLDPELVEQLDKAAKERMVSRNLVVAWCITEGLRNLPALAALGEDQP